MSKNTIRMQKTIRCLTEDLEWLEDILKEFKKFDLGNDEWELVGEWTFEEWTRINHQIDYHLQNVVDLTDLPLV